MREELTFNVFLSHSRRNTTVVRPPAERLRQDGRRLAM